MTVSCSCRGVDAFDNRTVDDAPCQQAQTNLKIPQTLRIDAEQRNRKIYTERMDLWCNPAWKDR